MSNRPGPQIDPSPAEKFFGLSARPFSLTPDLRFAFHSRSHSQALEQVTSSLRRREGLIVVTGAIGSGKTMLCRTMLETFETRTFLSLILDPKLSVEDLLRQVLTDFGIMDGLDVPKSGPMSDVTRHQLVSTLQQFLATLIPLQAHAVIMIDEAQHLSPEVLEEIRLLSNFETDEAKLLQIVLVGQPDLGELLRRPDLQQLAQRVARHCELHPLSEQEVADYVERRLTVAASPTALSGQGEPVPAETAKAVRFSAPALKTVADISGGMPRIVNVLCDRAIEAAYVREVRVVDPDAVMTAAGQLRLAIADDVIVPAATRRTPLVAALVVVLALAAIGALWWWQHQKPAAPAGPPPASTVAPTPTPTAADTPAASSPDAAPVFTPASTDARTPGDRPATTNAAPTSSVPAAAPVARPDSPSGSFTIAVASFRTESRAHDVEAAITAMGLSVVVRPDVTGTWSVVTAGPFATRADATAAQDTLASKGYPNTRILQVQP